MIDILHGGTHTTQNRGAGRPISPIGIVASPTSVCVVRVLAYYVYYVWCPTAVRIA